MTTPACPTPRGESRQDKADILLALLQRGPCTWHDLHLAGLDRTAALLAVGDIAAAGQHRIRVGPLLVELEPQEDDA